MPATYSYKVTQDLEGFVDYGGEGCFVVRKIDCKLALEYIHRYGELQKPKGKFQLVEGTCKNCVIKNGWGVCALDEGWDWGSVLDDEHRHGDGQCYEREADR